MSLPRRGTCHPGGVSGYGAAAPSTTLSASSGVTPWSTTLSMFHSIHRNSMPHPRILYISNSAVSSRGQGRRDVLDIPEHLRARRGACRPPAGSAPRSRQRDAGTTCAADLALSAAVLPAQSLGVGTVGARASFLRVVAPAYHCLSTLYDRDATWTPVRLL